MSRGGGFPINHQEQYYSAIHCHGRDWWSCPTWSSCRITTCRADNAHIGLLHVHSNCPKISASSLCGEVSSNCMLWWNVWQCNVSLQLHATFGIAQKLLKCFFYSLVDWSFLMLNDLILKDLWIITSKKKPIVFTDYFKSITWLYDNNAGLYVCNQQKIFL